MICFYLILSSQSPELYLFFPQNEVTAYVKKQGGCMGVELKAEFIQR